MFGPFLVMMLQLWIKEKENPDRPLEIEDGIKGRVLGKKPYLLQSFIYYFACLIGPPSLTIYLLVDRLFHLFGVSFT